MGTTTIAIGYEQNLPATHPEAFIEREIDVPELGPHDLLVEVEAVSVNPVDVKQRAGAPADGFRVLGFDASGTVRAIGAEVTLFAVGDEVFYAGSIDRPGTNQRLHVVDERITGRKPTKLSFVDSAALPLTAITAWEALFDRLGLTDASTGTLLVVGATGGVGSILLQLAEVFLPNVTVVATASDEDRAAWVRGFGAEQVINHREDIPGQIAEIEPNGVDWVFSAHSADQIETYAQILRPFGHIVAIDDSPRDMSALKRKSIAWHWEFMFTRPVQQTPDMIEQHRLLNVVSDLVDRDLIRTTTTKTLTPISADTLREAHALIEGGHTVGKLVISGWK